MEALSCPALMQLVIKEITDNSGSGLHPSSVLEHHDAGSLLYLLESTPTLETELADFDRLVDNELLADALGHRLLAMSGYDVEDELADEQDALASLALALDSDDIGTSALAGLRRRVQTRPTLPGRRIIHQEGFVAPRAAFEYAEADDNENGEVEDEEEEFYNALLGDEYFDWLGSQMVRRQAGLPCWVIDDEALESPVDAIEPLIELEVADDMDVDYVPFSERPRKTAKFNDM